MSDEEDISLILSKSSLPAVQISLRGFRSTEEADAAGAAVGAWLRLFGVSMDLSQLDGVTVAYDFDAALGSIDRGYEASQPQGRTNDEFALGLAKTISVLREGKPKAHIVMHAAIADWLKDADHREQTRARYILAHEAAHAHDLARRSAAFGDAFLRQQLNQEDGTLFQVADACWTEYAASRLSAWVWPEQTVDFEKTFCDVLGVTFERGNALIRKYRREGEIGKLYLEIVGSYGNLAKYASYLLGHVAGMKLTMDHAAPRACQSMEAHPYFSGLFRELAGSLKALWANYGSWNGGIHAYDPLTAFARRLLKVGGIELSTRPTGLYVDVPWSPETLPEPE